MRKQNEDSELHLVEIPPRATGTRATGTRATVTRATGTRATVTRATVTRATGTRATGTRESPTLVITVVAFFATKNQNLSCSINLLQATLVTTFTIAEYMSCFVACKYLNGLKVQT